MSQQTSNPARYRRMSEPFDSREQANQAITEFFADVEAAREKHRISDVVVLVEVGMVVGDVETRASAQLALGSRAYELPMLARAFGAAQARHQNDLALILAQARGGSK